MVKQRCAECGAWLNLQPMDKKSNVYCCQQCGKPQGIDEGPEESLNNN